MLISGASQNGSYGLSTSQVLATSAANDSSLLTLGSSTTSASGLVSDSSTGSSLFGAASATNLFGTSGNPFGDSSSLFGANTLDTQSSALLINAQRDSLQSQQVSMTNLDSVTLESIAASSDAYMQEQAALDGSGGDPMAALGALIDQMA